MPDTHTDLLEPPATQASGWRRRAAGLAGLLVSGGLLAVLYRSIDARLVGEALARSNPSWLIVSVGLILPITVVRAFRFLWVAPPGALPGAAEALRLTLVSSALNVFLPAKTGDLVKSYFLANRGTTSPGVAVAVVAYERFCDMFALIAWCLVAWAIARPVTPGVPLAFWGLLAVVGLGCLVLVLSERMGAALCAAVERALPSARFRTLHALASGWPGLLRLLRGRRLGIIGFSLGLWLAHLFQIWLFTVALSVDVPLAVSMSLTGVALMAGQLPLTVAGVGTRDVALVVLMARYIPPQTAAALGVLVASRNLLPPLFGVPLMRAYLTTVVADARRWRQQVGAGRWRVE
ncbi:MAG: flippase-like domain-containing protein [Acidobacteria bacterium]|nr:flippase-like domain-containing protein [Acidobacteriota bacterium]